MKHFRNSQGSAGKLGGMAVLAVCSALAFAIVSQPALADNLHGVCEDGTTACGSNGSTLTDSANPATFEFTYAGNGKTASGPQTGVFYLDFLVPESDGILSGSVTVTGSVSGTATLFSTTPWTTKGLADYLGDTGASPTNPIGAYGSGFYVYQLDLGSQTLCQNGQSCSSPIEETVNGLPEGSYILAFMNTAAAGTPADWVATPNSESILETGTPTAVTPEPSSIALLGSGVLGLAGVVRRRFRC